MNPKRNTVGEFSSSGGAGGGQTVEVPAPTVQELILQELVAIRLLLEQGNRNTGLKRPGAVRFNKR
jgi:hypothetical protein